MALDGIDQLASFIKFHIFHFQETSSTQVKAEKLQLLKTANKTLTSEASPSQAASPSHLKKEKAKKTKRAKVRPAKAKADQPAVQAQKRKKIVKVKKRLKRAP
jgi:hypothetical protein